VAGRRGETLNDILLGAIPKEIMTLSDGIGVAFGLCCLPMAARILQEEE